MTTKLLAPTAQNINDAHRLARSSAETAVQHAIRCGQMLAAKKAALKHGEFQKWVADNCEFAYSTAARYMKAGENSTAVEISSLSRLFPSGQPSAKPQKEQRKPNTSARSVKGAVINPPESAAQGSEAGNPTMRHGEEPEQMRPSVPAFDADAPFDEPTPTTSVESTKEIFDKATALPLETELDEPERPEDDPGEYAQLAAVEREIGESEEKILRADDTVAALHDEIKRQSAEIAVLKLARDGYMNGQAAVTRMLKAEQRKVERLTKQLQKAESELERIRERIAIMEAA